MFRRFSLRIRIIILLAALLSVTVAGGLISIWHSYMTEKLFSTVTESNIQALEAAGEAENALVMQKGYVTYFFQDSDPQWLGRLEKYHGDFQMWLSRCRRGAETQEERDILNQIESEYIRFAYDRNEVIDLYKAGHKNEGFALQKKIRPKFFHIIELTHQFKEGLEARITQIRQTNRERAQLFNVLSSTGVLISLVLGIILALILINQVLAPIRRLLRGPETSEVLDGAGNEMAALSQRFETLQKDVDQTRSKLQWSRAHLEQAGKWALVGKLAAGVAHSVRNPLTSVKMRLFSLERTLQLTPEKKDDFEVISEEIRHIDTIANNFLEFARPPKLKVQKVSPSDTVDMALQLLRHRLESYQVAVDVQRDGRLPEIMADSDQLKEVLVNLMVNACEAMVNGGKITIQERTGYAEDLGPTVVIAVKDNGPGVPQAVQSKLFQPFYSTKEEGTGLGLSIASRVVEEHGGWIDLKSIEGQGATFIITLPLREGARWELSS